jgi:hypothetical protein
MFIYKDKMLQVSGRVELFMQLRYDEIIAIGKVVMPKMSKIFYVT